MAARACALLALALLPAGCTRVFFQPDRALRAQPEAFGLAYRLVRFDSTDGTPLTGIYFPAAGRAKATVVHFHGNGGNVSGHFPYSAWLAAEGYNVFVFDYRGFGGSGGRPSQAGVVEDGVAALRAARTLPGADPSRLVVFAQSLGGPVALAALERTASTGVRALVLEGSFPSYRSVAKAKLRGAGLLRLAAPLVPLLVAERFDPLRTPSRLQGLPKLVLHQKDDPVVPYAEGRALFEALPEPKTFVDVPGAGHAEAFLVSGAARELRPLLLGFLARSLR